MDETLSALSRVQKCFGSFLLGKVMGIGYSAKAEATVQKAAVVGAETPGAGWLEGGRDAGASLLGHRSSRGLQEGLLIHGPEISLWGRILG